MAGPATTHFTLFELPLGLAAVTAAKGALTRLALFDSEEMRDAWIERHARSAMRDDDEPLFAALREQLRAYCDEGRAGFDLPIALEGTPFQREVWSALQGIPRGTTTSYAELAATIGRPRAVRAVGRANGQNPISVIVPCHRVIGAGGELTGYAGGLEMKRRLLELERALPEPAGESLQLPLFDP